MLKRLPITILFHATLALIYFPTIIFSFVFTNRRTGVAALTALIGLGILAALDMFIIRRKINQRAFRAIEIFVVMVQPLSILPVILSCFSLLSVGPLAALILQMQLEVRVLGMKTSWPWIFMNSSTTIAAQNPSGVSEAFAITATLAVIVPNYIYIFYIWIAAVIDQLRVDAHWLSHPDWQAQSSSRAGKPRYFFGTRRTPVERAAVINHCASYIFKHSVFRKHTFEPTGWAIVRGVVAVYSCIGIIIFSAYSGVSEVQLYGGAKPVQETISDQYPPTALYTTGPTASAYPTYVLASSNSCNKQWAMEVITSTDVPNTNPQPMDGPYTSTEQYGSPCSWSTQLLYNQDFSVSWNVTVPLTLRMTAGGTPGDLQWTDKFTLLPSKNYSISLSMVTYTLGSGSWVLFEPEIMGSVPSGSNDTMATFSLDVNQLLITQRDLSLPSAFIAVTHILSNVGGTYAFIEGFFALIFGRTIMAILLGNRAISPFGLLGIVTRNRFKKLIHEQFPRIQEDIERGGMAAYISEVAIDAALMDVPPVKGQTNSSPSSHTGHETEGENDIGVSHLRVGSNVSHLKLPYAVEEFQGDLDNHSLPSRRRDVE